MPTNHRPTKTEASTSPRLSESTANRTFTGANLNSCTFCHKPLSEHSEGQACPPLTPIQCLEAIAAFWGRDEHGNAICEAPIHPGAYITELDEPIRDVIRRTLRAGKRQQSETKRQLNAAIEHLGTLADYLQEAHSEEYDSNHGGDGCAGCSYCEAIAQADTLQREAIGLPARPVKRCNACEIYRPIFEEDGEATCLLCGSDDIGLKSERNTPEVQGDVESIEPEDGREHEALNAHFEHGHWWLTCGSCGASWSVVDVNDSLDLEEIDHGDESCPLTA